MRRAVESLTGDTTSGASELLRRGIDVVRSALVSDRSALVEVARALGDAQPSMASFWNLGLAALRELDEPGAVERFAERQQRAGAALVRVALEVLTPADGPSLRLATASFSGSVLAVLLALARRTDLTVDCGEGRPHLEGRRLAAALADAGIAVALRSDAALGALVFSRSVDAVIVGADAVTPSTLVNKIGTGPLAATALYAGTPLFVLASRDKFLDERSAGLLRIEEHDPAEIWRDGPGGVAIRNPYFERVSLDVVTATITDAGVLAGEMVAEACRAASVGATDQMIAALQVAPEHG
ncbi:MAG TPA: hypothetical protein VGK32_20155 [Vicinamibacterales bacterium]